MLTDAPVPAELSGRVWLSVERTVLHMQGEVDVVTVAEFRETLDVPDPGTRAVAELLEEVRVVDMGAVTFADSAAIGLIAGIVFVRARTGRRVTVRAVPQSIRFVLDVVGVLEQVDLVD